MDGINLKQVPNEAHNPRSNFDLSFKRAFDFKFGDLIPVLSLPVMPDDEISVSYEFLHRMAPFLSQVFQDYKVTFDFYFVPNQLVYNQFDLFMSSGYDGNTNYIHPYINPGKISKYSPNNLNYLHTIFDYLDISPSVWLASETVLNMEHWNAIPFAAYVQAYLDHHIGVDTALNKLKEQIMSDEYVLTSGDMTQKFTELFGKINSRNPDWTIPGTTNFNPASIFAPFKRLYPLDYFTSARSNPQLGPVMTIPMRLVNTDNNGTETFVLSQPSATTGVGALGFEFTSGSNKLRVGELTSSTVAPKSISINGSILNNVATINDFYSAARLQELLTLYNYSGFAPGDKLAAEFGVKNPDGRLHKAEWLHSSIHDISVGEVFSSNVNNEAASSANLDIPGSATAVSATSQADRGFRAYFTQYGWIIGMMSCYPEASYSQGIPRWTQIADRFDYPHYLLSEIGMSAIRKKEIFAAQVNQQHWNDEFAYMSQYGDSKVSLNRVNGNIRGNLRYMNAGRMFANQVNPNYIPSFNDEFLQVDPARNDLNRTFNVIGSYAHDCPMLSKIDFRIYAKRQLPYYGLPRF